MKLLLAILIWFYPIFSYAAPLNLICDLQFKAQYHLYGRISKEDSGISKTRVTVRTSKDISDMRLSGSSNMTDAFVMVGAAVEDTVRQGGLAKEFLQFNATDKSDEKTWHFINDTLDLNQTMLRTDIQLRRTDGFLVFRSAFKNPETPNIDVVASGFCAKEADKLLF